MLHTKFGKDWLRSFCWEDVNGQRTTTTAIGHPSDSVHLKTNGFVIYYIATIRFEEHYNRVSNHVLSLLYIVTNFFINDSFLIFFSLTCKAHDLCVDAPQIVYIVLKAVWSIQIKSNDIIEDILRIYSFLYIFKEDVKLHTNPCHAKRSIWQFAFESH